MEAGKEVADMVGGGVGGGWWLWVNKCISIIDEGDISLNSLSREAQVELRNLHALDTRLENANNIMSSIQAESLELARELSNYLQNVDIDENLQQRVEEKIQSIFNFHFLK